MLVRVLSCLSGARAGRGGERSPQEACGDPEFLARLEVLSTCQLAEPQCSAQLPPVLWSVSPHTLVMNTGGSQIVLPNLGLYHPRHSVGILGRPSPTDFVPVRRAESDF